ncbi:MAG: arsenic ABC transporter [Candidatus Methanomethylophilaceae archaeon]|nr:arsenic ABC transporter [Candidatus Methanomethylophilaceae archaeon]
MDWELIITAVIFLITYFLLSVRRLPGIRISMWAATVIGAVLLIIFGIVSVNDALESQNYDVLILLLGMMLVVASLEICGFFDIAANSIISRSKDGKTLLLMTMILSAVLSALVLNDAVVLLLTPTVIKCCRRLNTNPLPYILGIFISANIGSVATVVGNPQNAYIATEMNIGFLEFSQYLAPLAIMCLIVAYFMMTVLFRKDLQITPGCVEHYAEKDNVRLPLVVTILILMIVLFSASSFLGISISAIAITGGVLSFIIVSTKGLNSVKYGLKRIDWGVLVFFIGLFAIMSGVISSGLLDLIANLFPGLEDGVPSILELTVFSTLVSNLVSNVPSVILIGELIQPDVALWLVLAASSTLAGNMTMIGAAANVIVSEEAEKESIKIDFWKYLKIGVPISLVTLMIMYVYLSVVL